jgi:hypothetical protein
MGFLERCGVVTSPPDGNGNGGTTINIPVPLAVTTQPKTAFTTFDTANPGIPLHYPLERPGRTQQLITFSTAAYANSADFDFQTVGTTQTAHQQLMTDPDRIISDMTTGFIQHLGNNTAFAVNHLWIAPITGVIRQLQVCAAFGLNVSAFTSGTFSISSVDFSLQSWQASGQPSPFNSQATIRVLPETAFTPLGAIGTEIYVVTFTMDTFIRTFRGKPTTFSITVNETTGTGTRQVGIVPLFPMYAAAGNRAVYESQVIARMEALPDQAQDMVGLTDYNLTGLEGQ